MCGRCRVIFTDIDEYFNHKKERKCQKFSKSSTEIITTKPVDSPLSVGKTEILTQVICIYHLIEKTLIQQ